jgi:hypothetical protein
MPIRTFLRKFARACRYRADAADQPQRGKIAHCDRYQSSLRGLLAVMPKLPARAAPLPLCRRSVKSREAAAEFCPGSRDIATATGERHGAVVQASQPPF